MTQARRTPGGAKKAKDETPAEHEHYILSSIETDASMDALETIEPEDPEHPGPTRYRLSMHVEIPEHIAQAFFSTFVREGRINVEFHPTDADEDDQQLYIE